MISLGYYLQISYYFSWTTIANISAYFKCIVSCCFFFSSNLASVSSIWQSWRKISHVRQRWNSRTTSRKHSKIANTCISLIKIFQRDCDCSDCDCVQYSQLRHDLEKLPSQTHLGPSPRNRWQLLFKELCLLEISKTSLHNLKLARNRQ